MYNFVLDFETGGLESSHHAPVQIAWAIFTDNWELLQSRCFDILPDDNDDICIAAIKVNNLTIERLLKGKNKSLIIQHLIEDSLTYRESTLVGFNISFDIGFLVKMFERESKIIHTYFSLRNAVDVRQAFLLMKRLCKNLPNEVIQQVNTKLTSLTELFSIKHNAHDALGDVLATAELMKIIERYFRESRI